LPRVAMQAARARHFRELAFDLGDALADQAAVGFDLRFAGAAQEAEAAALALKMRPAANQARALVCEMRKLRLQAALARLGPLAENFENERGAVQHLGVPGALEIALLHRRKLRVDDDDFRLKP